MAYLTAANLRPDTHSEFAANVTLTQAEASDSRLTAAIAAYSQLLDDLTGDHFEIQDDATVELDVPLVTSSLVVPRRIKSITTVKTRNYAGTLTTETAANYRVNPSLDSTGAVRLHSGWDTIEIIPEGPGLSTGWAWPVGTQTVQLVGDFGWTTCPRAAKRFVALLCFDHFKNRRADLGRVEVVQNANETVRYVLPDAAAGIYTGIVEADAIVADLRRRDPAVMIG